MQKIISTKRSKVSGYCCLVLFVFFYHLSLASGVSGTEETVNAEPAPIATSKTTDTVLEPAVNQKASSPSTTTSPVVSLKNPGASVSSTTQMVSLLGGLGLIILLILALSWFVKRFSQGGFLQNPLMKVVSAMPLGTRERLMLVDVGGKHILLGVTAAQINTLHVFDVPVELKTPEKSPQSSEFSQKLMAILQQKNAIDDQQRNQPPQKSNN